MSFWTDDMAIGLSMFLHLQVIWSDETSKILYMTAVIFSNANRTPPEQTTDSNYRQNSNLRRTKPQNSNVSRLVLQLSLYNLLKPCVKSMMKM